MARKEDRIQYECAQWLRDNRIPHHHSPNATKRGAREGSRLKAMGMRAGFHDLILFFNGGVTVLIELKTDDGKLLDSQERWHKEVDTLGGHHQHIIQAANGKEAIAQLKDIVARYR